MREIHSHAWTHELVRDCCSMPNLARVKRREQRNPSMGVVHTEDHQRVRDLASFDFEKKGTRDGQKKTTRANSDH